MKDLMRRKTSLSEEIEAILNEQIRIEAQSSSKYLAMAAWCGANGFENSESFFMDQAEEERAHMLKIFQYIGNAGGSPLSPATEEVKHDYANLREVFERSLEQEIGVTRAIHRIVDLCRKSQDYTTDSFMQWFIKEQMEEEFIARRMVELLDVIGDEGQALYFVDQEVPKITYVDAEAADGAE